MARNSKELKYPAGERREEGRSNENGLEYIITSVNSRAEFRLYIPDGNGFKRVAKGNSPIVVREKYAEMKKNGTL